MIRISFLCAFALLLLRPVAAQPGNLGQIELSVTDRYKAQVSEATMLRRLPQYRDSTTERLPVRYSIMSQPLPVRFSPQTISPARVAKVKVPDIYRGLVRAGFGFYTTPFVEAYYNSGRSSKSSYGFSGRHFSTQGGVQDIVFEDNALIRNDLGGYYTRHFRRFSWKTELEGQWDKYSYYGRPRPATWNEDSLLGEAPYNWYRHYALRSSLHEARDGSMGALSQSAVAYRYFQDNYRSQEHDLDLNTRWKIPAQDEHLYLELNGAWFQTRYDSLYQGADSSQLFQRDFFQVQARPYFRVEREDYSFDFGLNVYFVEQMDSRPERSESNLFFFPELHFQYKLVPDILSLSAGMKGNVERNTYRDLTLALPYILPGQESRPTRDFELWLQLDGALSSRSNFRLRGGYRLQRDRALFYRQPFLQSDSLPYALAVEYADMGIFYAQGDLNLRFNPRLQTELQLLVRAFEMQSNTRPWHLPYFEGTWQWDYQLGDKISTQLGLSVIGPRQAFDQLRNPDLAAMLSGYFDLHWQLEYFYNSRISAFINFNNLLNQQYDLVLGYRNQSINALFGFNYRF